MFILIGKKIGMTRVFEEDGRKSTPVTILEVKNNRVVGLKSEVKDGYSAVQVGWGKNNKEKRKPVLGNFKKGVVPKVIREFRSEENSYNIGDVLDLSLLKENSYVDVKGISVGRGFQGVVKRHGMSGGPSGHGSHFHRSPGSIGNCSDPSRVFKGRKLPGRMGGSAVMVQNLKIVSIDEKSNLLLIKGAVPGYRNGWVTIKESVKK